MSRVSPATPESETVSPTDRVHRMRTARGACWVIVVGAAGAAALVLLDGLIPLPGWVRGFGLATWITAVGVFGWRLVVRPLRDRNAQPSPSLSPHHELPGNLRAATAATLALMVCVLVAALLPGAPDHLRRVAFPWQRGVLARHRVTVTSGDTVVRRGGTVTLSAYVENLGPGVPPATSATFIIRPHSHSQQERFTSLADASGAFHIIRSTVNSSFEYFVEVEGAVSERFTVTAIDAIELADGSTTELVPPRYAPSAARSHFRGFAPLDGFPYSTAEYRFRFTRPAASASLEFLPPGGSLELTPITLSEDGVSGTSSFRLRENGTLRLVLIAEEKGQKLRTDIPVSVRVKPDRNPRFSLVRGLSPRPASANPELPLNIEIAAEDDIAIGAAALEYLAKPSDSEAVSIPIPLSGLGTQHASGKLVFPIPKRVREGETIRVRLRVSDTRELQETGLLPQVSYYPEDGWLTLRIDPAAASMDEQEIVGRRDRIRELLAAVRGEIQSALANIETVLAENKAQSALATDHTIRLNSAREAVRNAEKDVRAAAREAYLNPELHSLAHAARAIVERLTTDVDESLRQVLAAPATDRAASLATSIRKITAISDEIGGVLARNDLLARDRLDARTLGMLAMELDNLANTSANLPAQELLKKHRDWNARFEKLLADSEELRKAADGARYLEFQRLASNATNLASAVRSLNTAMKELHAEARLKLLAWVATEQRSLAVRAESLLTGCELAARLAGVVLPRREELRRVPALLASGKTLEALTEMATLGQSLDNLAEVFEKSVVDRSDTKAAVRQLALWQSDLHTRVRTATESAAGKALPAPKQAAFRAEELAIIAALMQIALPPGESSRTTRDAVLNQLQTAATSITGAATTTDRAMLLAATELDRFADRLPTTADRLSRTRTDLEKIWREQESIQVGVEQVLRNTLDPALLPARIGTLLQRQQSQVSEFLILDLPGLEPRRDRVVAILSTAADDLAAALPMDIPASQHRARRELDWLRMLLSDDSPPNDRAREIALRLTTAEKTIERLGLAATEAQLALHIATLQDVKRQLNQFPPSPDASMMLNAARDAVQAAESLFRTAAPLVDKLRSTREATAAAQRLSELLNGGESDLERLRALAESRRAGAAFAAKARDKKQNVNPTQAAELLRLLGHEIEELRFTRVGIAGQTRKKRALALYSQLKDNPAPERMSGLQSDIATLLEELAALTADIPELAGPLNRTPVPGPPSQADGYLPSRRVAEEIRALSQAYRASRESITDLPGELTRRLRPTDAASIIELEREQRGLAGEIAAMAKKLSNRAVVDDVYPGEIAADAASAAERIRDGALSAAKQPADRAAIMLRKLTTANSIQGAEALAAKQEAVHKKLAVLMDSPGAVAEKQQLREKELLRDLASLIQTLEMAALDAGPNEATAKVINESVASASAAEKLLKEAAQKSVEAIEMAAAPKLDDAVSLRAEAEANLRAAAGLVAGAGPVTTTLPNFDPQSAIVGESLRRAESAVRQAERLL
ncbi:MAG TPA: hypothetical protein VLM40_17105, partial [Gemmata sp.]|nr:hypothetical protein [Gemmata sp.]